MPLTRVMVATDHSDTAQRAEEFAGRLAGPGSTLEVYLLYVLPEPPAPAGRAGVADVYVPTERLQPADREQMHALLGKASAAIRAAAGANQISVKEDLVGSSDIAGTIVREAEAAGVEAIVIGSRGRSGLTELVLGSVSHKVLHLAHCPVIVVR
jgi:nucleotide-binding universal stress UspA family protein